MEPLSFKPTRGRWMRSAAPAARVFPSACARTALPNGEARPGNNTTWIPPPKKPRSRSPAPVTRAANMWLPPDPTTTILPSGRMAKDVLATPKARGASAIPLPLKPAYRTPSAVERATATALSKPWTEQLASTTMPSGCIANALAEAPAPPNAASASPPFSKLGSRKPVVSCRTTAEKPSPPLAKRSLPSACTAQPRPRMVFPSKLVTTTPPVPKPIPVVPYLFNRTNENEMVSE